MTSSSSQAFCTLAPLEVAPTPSIVVTARLPTAPTGSRQDRTGLPSICTVQAPHCAMPQPNLVPVIPSTSRSTQSSGVSLGASKLWSSPLIFKFMMTNLRRCGILNGVQHSCIERIFCANAEWVPDLQLRGDGESWNFCLCFAQCRQEDPADR